MKRRKIMVLFLAVIFVFSFVVNTYALENLPLNESIMLEQLQNLKQNENPAKTTFTEESNSDPSTSSTFTFDTWAFLNPSRSNPSVIIYEGLASCSQAMQQISIDADLQYKSPVGGSYITEVNNPAVTQYGVSSVMTPAYMFQDADYGYWRCKATGSYVNLLSIPPTNTIIDYNDTPYYYMP